MKKINSFLLATACLLLSYSVFANETSRKMQFSNEKIAVWETIIYPSKKQILKMHRHDHDRILVAFTDGVLKITNNKGQTHYLNLKKHQAYFLSKDEPNELHTDENMSKKPVKVLVAEFKN